MVHVVFPVWSLKQFRLWVLQTSALIASMHVYPNAGWQQGPQRDQKKADNAEDWKAARFCLSSPLYPFCVLKLDGPMLHSPMPGQEHLQR